MMNKDIVKVTWCFGLNQETIEYYINLFVCFYINFYTDVVICVELESVSGHKSIFWIIFQRSSMVQDH